MENNIQMGVNRLWKRACLFLVFLMFLYGLSAYFNRAVFTPDPSHSPSIETSVASFVETEYLVVFHSSYLPYFYSTASIKEEGDTLRIYFKRRVSLIPVLPFGKDTTIFGDPWHQVFAFEITDNINAIVDASTEAILWQRKDVLNGE